MKITMTNKPIISSELKVTQKEMENPECFLEDFMGMILSACESLCVRKGINDLEKRKEFTKDILNYASIMAENVYSEMIKEQTESLGKNIKVSELIDFMDDIYNEYIEMSTGMLGKTKEEIFKLLDEKEDYTLEVKADVSQYIFYLTDSTGNSIPLGQIGKKSTDEEKKMASQKALIFASRLLYYALGEKHSGDIFKKYENLEYMYGLIKNMEKDNNS